MKLKKTDYIVCAFAESHAGPGWSNSPIHVIVNDRETGRIREEYIQPDEQNAEMITLFGISKAAHYAMTSVVQSKYKK